MSEMPYNSRGLDYVAEGNCIAINRSLIRAFGLHAAVMVGELASEAKCWNESGLLSDGWLFMTVEHVERDTCLGERAQRSAIETLKKHGILEVAYRGLPRKRCFRINCMAIIQAIAEVDELEADDGGARCSTR